MTDEEIISYCLSKPYSYIDYPFGQSVTIVKVYKRIFAQVFILKGERCATFNCDIMMGEFYRNIYKETVTRGYHCPKVQQPYFNTVKLNGNIPNDEIKRMIDLSYATVLTKLPKYIQKKIKETP